MKIELKILNKELYGEEGNFYMPLPDYQTLGSAGIDLVCTEDITIYPGETKQIHTGIAIYIGSHTDATMKSYREHWDYAGMIISRSGMGTKGLILANTVGLIDSDYQGELLVQVWNRNNEYKTVDRQSNEGPWQEIEWNTENKMELKAGDRFAQLVIVPIARAKWKVVEEFTSTTDRGAGGFGSTDNET